MKFSEKNDNAFFLFRIISKLNFNIIRKVVKSLSKAILVIGASSMGYGVIKTLLSKGHTVYVNDLSVDAVDK